MSEPNGVIAPIEKAWHELDDLVRSLGPGALTLPGRDGWAVKDHLVHIAAWEHSLLALIEGTDRHNAMGVGPEVDGTDAINAAVWAMHRDKTAGEALDYFHQTHALLMKRLGTMSDADLQLSYNHYQPDEQLDPRDDRQVLDWVKGNTFEHYAEHVDWINQMVRESSAAR